MAGAARLPARGLGLVLWPSHLSCLKRRPPVSKVGGTRSPWGWPAPRNACPCPRGLAGNQLTTVACPGEPHQHSRFGKNVGGVSLWSYSAPCIPIPWGCHGAPRGDGDPHHSAGVATPGPCADMGRTTQPSAADGPLFLHPTQGQHLTRRHCGAAREGGGGGNGLGGGNTWPGVSLG